MTRNDQPGPTNGDTLSTSPEIMNYTYDAFKIHAVTHIQTGSTVLWGGTYNDNGSLLVKHSSLNPNALPDQNYYYDSDDRMTAASVGSGQYEYRISDSFYHLSGVRLFEGLLAKNYVQGSLFINPYYELKITNGQVYTVKHILAGGRRVASVYTLVTSYNRAGLGCSMVGDNMTYASPREIMIGMFLVFGLPLFIVVLVSTRGFRTRGFRKHPIKSLALLGICIICLVEFSPYPMLLLDGSNPVDDRLIAKNLQAVLTGTWGKTKIPLSKLDKEFFDNQEQLRKQKKLMISFGPRMANASTLVSDTLYFHTDQLGSTRLITRANGTVYQYLNYMPFGRILEGVIHGRTFSWDAGPKNTYTGQEYDRSTGLYYYGARFYDADIGRFISADTVIPQPADGQTFNRYTYVNNNPFKFTDPTGHNPLVIIAMILAVGYAAYQAITNPSPESFWNFVTTVISVAAILTGHPEIAIAITALNMVPKAVKASQGDRGALVDLIVSSVMLCISIYSYESDTYLASTDPQSSNSQGLPKPDPNETLQEAFEKAKNNLTINAQKGDEIANATLDKLKQVKGVVFEGQESNLRETGNFYRAKILSYLKAGKTPFAFYNPGDQKLYICNRFLEYPSGIRDVVLVHEMDHVYWHLAGC